MTLNMRTYSALVGVEGTAGCRVSKFVAKSHAKWREMANRHENETTRHKLRQNLVFWGAFVSGLRAVGDVAQV